MNLLRRLFRTFDRRRGARARSPYAYEVLFSGWVDLPAAFRDAFKGARIRRP